MIDLLMQQDKIGTTNGPEAAPVSQAFVVRSRREILRLLNGVIDHQVPLSIHFLNDGGVLPSALIYADESCDTLLLECPPAWEAAVKTHGETIMVGCVFEDSKLEFQGGAGAIVDLDGTPVVGLPLPEFMWRVQRRRNPRHAVSGLNIVLNMGFLEADAEVIDLSVGGIGMLNCHRDLKLAAGEVMPGCSITLPGFGQIAVDLTVQHVRDVQLGDGRCVTRAGCRFSGLKDSARQTIAHFLALLAQQ